MIGRVFLAGLKVGSAGLKVVKSAVAVGLYTAFPPKPSGDRVAARITHYGYVDRQWTKNPDQK